MVIISKIPIKYNWHLGLTSLALMLIKMIVICVPQIINLTSILLRIKLCILSWRKTNGWLGMMFREKKKEQNVLWYLIILIF